MSLKFVTRKLKTQTLGDDEGDVNEVKEKDVRAGESSKSDINNKEDNVVSSYIFDNSRKCHDFTKEFHELILSCIILDLISGWRRYKQERK